MKKIKERGTKKIRRKIKIIYFPNGLEEIKTQKKKLIQTIMIKKSLSQ